MPPAAVNKPDQIIFLNVAETMANAKGHWMSDLAGSKQTAGGGAGLPGSFMSMMKELSALPIFKDTNFGVNLKKAYEKGTRPAGLLALPVVFPVFCTMLFHIA